MPDDRYTESFPDILTDIVTELDYHWHEGNGTRSHRPKLLILASQALLLKPGSNFDLVWPTLLHLLQEFIQTPDPSSHMIWSILLVILSIITRRRGGKPGVDKMLRKFWHYHKLISRVARRSHLFWD